MFPGVPATFLLTTSLLSPSLAFWGEEGQVGKGLLFPLLLPFLLVTPLPSVKQDALCLTRVLIYTEWWDWVHVPVYLLSPFTFSTPFFVLYQPENKVGPESSPSYAWHGRAWHWKNFKSALIFRAQLKTVLKNV